MSSIIIDWKSAGEVLAEDLVPFLVPSNWARVTEMKQLSDVAKESHHGVLKNIVFQTKLMYLQIQQEILQYNLYENLHDQQEQLLHELTTLIHLSPQIKKWHQDLSYSNEFLKSDLLDLENLIWEERQQLSLALGLNPSEIVLTESLTVQDHFSEVMSTEGENLLEHSCELKEYEFLLNVAPKVKKEILWNILGVTSVTRGMAGGIFDEIPVQDGLGFGMGPSLRIHKSQVEVIKRQREGVVNVLSRQLQTVEYQLKLLLDKRQVSFDKIKLLAQEKSQLEWQQRLGSEGVLYRLLELEQKIVLSKVEYADVNVKTLIEKEKLLRLFERDDYYIEH